MLNRINQLFQDSPKNCLLYTSGGTTITVTDQEKESRSIDLWVPLNLDDPTPRIYWDGYRADINTVGVSSTGSDVYKRQVLDVGTDIDLIHSCR